MPSYAHPIIGEWSDEGTSSLLASFKSPTPNRFESSIDFKTKSGISLVLSADFAVKDCLNFLGANKWQYCNPPSFLSDKDITPSSGLMVLKYFWNKLTVHFWMSANILAPWPDAITSTVVPEVYPTPPFLTMTLTISPFSIMGTNWAYFPLPFITRFGGELYPEPPLTIKTSWICPWVLTMTNNWAFFPLLKSKIGCLL